MEQNSQSVMVSFLRACAPWLARFLDPGIMRLFELSMVLVFGWHYIGCFWCAQRAAPLCERD